MSELINDKGIEHFDKEHKNNKSTEGVILTLSHNMQIKQQMAEELRQMGLSEAVITKQLNISN